MSWDHANPFTLDVRPQAGDIDGLNHTNNAVYVQWCEKVAWAHSEALGLDLADYRRLDRAMAIRRGEYDYLLPTGLDEALTLATWLLASDGKLTMERRFQLIRASDGATAEGDGVAADRLSCCVQIAKGSTSTAQRSRPLCSRFSAPSSGSQCHSRRCSAARLLDSTSIWMRSTLATRTMLIGTGG
jgi:acyl-CoA thioester hydrolase